jgi:hypothetical protein
MIDWGRSVSIYEWICIVLWIVTIGYNLWALKCLFGGDVSNSTCRFLMIISLMLNIAFNCGYILGWYMHMGDMCVALTYYIHLIVLFVVSLLDIKVLTIFNNVNEKFTSNQIAGLKIATCVLLSAASLPYAAEYFVTTAVKPHLHLVIKN